jgi:hypothetical protein
MINLRVDPFKMPSHQP